MSPARGSTTRRGPVGRALSETRHLGTERRDLFALRLNRRDGHTDVAVEIDGVTVWIHGIRRLGVVDDEPEPVRRRDRLVLVLVRRQLDLSQIAVDLIDLFTRELMDVALVHSARNRAIAAASTDDAARVLRIHRGCAAHVTAGASVPAPAPTDGRGAARVAPLAVRAAGPATTGTVHAGRARRVGAGRADVANGACSATASGCPAAVPSDG